ncbi:MAG: hypothetical protein NC918_00140 [Candidatus Omnitrophica bacterium]|nr:hypothetical protein [Candidatus Omnitrophota bacterium]
MNILKIFKLSIEKSIENTPMLILNNLFFFYFSILSIGFFATFFIIGLSFSYFYISPKNNLYLPTAFVIIAVGGFLSLMLFFAGLGTYLNFISQTISSKKNYNLIEELEYLDKNLLKFSIAGLLNYGLVVFIGIIFLVIWFIFEKNAFLFFLFFLLTYFIGINYFSFSFMTYPAIILDNYNPFDAFIKSIKLAKKYLIQSIISIIILDFFKLFGVFFLFLYPIFFFFIYMPIYGYYLIYYYKIANNRMF